ncbi:hypothetical protein MBANPS3_012590, partial [Mucor bainieri]
GNPDWSNIAFAILDKYSSFQKPVQASRSTVVAQQQLQEGDVRKLQASFDRLDDNLKWRLSTGTIVEDAMKGFALSYKVEHPAHSLILDFQEEAWASTFSPGELREMRSFDRLPLPEIEATLAASLSSISQAANAEDAYRIAGRCRDKVDFPQLEADDYAVSWAAESVCSLIKMYSNRREFPLCSTSSEEDLLTHMWGFLVSCFNTSTTDCKR